MGGSHVRPYRPWEISMINTTAEVWNQCVGDVIPEHGLGRHAPQTVLGGFGQGVKDFPRRAARRTVRPYRRTEGLTRPGPLPASRRTRRSSAAADSCIYQSPGPPDSPSLAGHATRPRPCSAVSRDA